jgi:tetratricopeptide (TPR) repeat protein
MIGCNLPDIRELTMKLSHPKIGLLLLVILISTSGCGYINSIRAKSQLNEATSAYKDKKYEDAEKYARKAIELDPSYENAWMNLAIILQTEYRRGDPSDINRKRAEEAIEYYRKIEEKNPNSEQGDVAFAAVTKLLDYLAQSAGDQADKAEQPDQKSKFKEEEKKLKDELLDWVRLRAKNENVSKPKRAEAYAVLANKDWECSLAITDKNKQNVQKPDGSVVIQYKKPADPKDYDDALKCVTEGLELAETAISLDSESETAWSQKYALLMEAGKLAKMEGNDSKAADYEKQATAAGEQGKKLHDKAKAAPSPSPPPAG